MGGAEIPPLLAEADGFCETRYFLSSSGWRTVAERPMVRASGASRRTRASARERRSPRFDVTRACNSSSTTVRSPAKKPSASRWASNSESCSGVVSRMSGGRWICRARLCAGVSPVRVSTVTARSMPAIGASRLRAMSTASALSGEM